MAAALEEEAEVAEMRGLLEALELGPVLARFDPAADSDWPSILSPGTS